MLDGLSVNDVSSIQVISHLYDSAEEEEILITNEAQIAEILNYFSQFELNASKLSNITYIESYWVTIKMKEKLAYGLTLYDNEYLSIYEYDARRVSSYSIKNEVGPPVIIRRLFEK